MTTPRVLNKSRVGVPSGAVYIGRPSKWGNPFAISPDQTREQVIERYRVMLAANPSLWHAARAELRGRDLVCFCAPQACHGDVLLEVANS